jgi:nucleotide-binding universal stress UspA family protein
VVGLGDPETESETLAAALELARALGGTVHLVRAYGAGGDRADAEAALTEALRAARAEGLKAVTHARRMDSVQALIAVASEQDADLLVVGGAGMSAAPRLLPGPVANAVSHHAPCNVLIVRGA